MNHPQPNQAFGPVVNRFRDVMAHSVRYSGRGISRLAADASISRSALSRLLNSSSDPSFLLVARVTDALEAELGIRLDPRDLIAESGRFPTRFTCDLVGCRCLPEAATDEFGDIKHSFHGVEPGKWVSSRYPLGFPEEMGVAHA